ncbi:MAG: RNA polymerase sigma factor [Deltaproteobacteria bacterium]|nr:RNA polymerase sigma factor [Deltaproteobacteria bacterium]
MRQTAYLNPAATTAELAHAEGSEAALVAACARGDRASLSTLYLRYHRRIFSLLVRMAGRQEAEELCQEVFVRVFRSVGSFRGEAALGTWIYRLAMNVCLTHLSRRARRGEVLAALPVEPPAMQETRQGNPWLRDRLETALRELPPGYRAVLILHDVEGLNHQEIAEILGCRVGTSKSQLHKARSRMRELLAPWLSGGAIDP